MLALLPPRWRLDVLSLGGPGIPKKYQGTDQGTDYISWDIFHFELHGVNNLATGELDTVRHRPEEGDCQAVLYPFNVCGFRISDSNFDFRCEYFPNLGAATAAITRISSV